MISNVSIQEYARLAHLFRKALDDSSKELVPSSIMRKFIYKSGRTQSAQGMETCP